MLCVYLAASTANYLDKSTITYTYIDDVFLVSSAQHIISQVVEAKQVATLTAMPSSIPIYGASIVRWFWGISGRQHANLSLQVVHPLLEHLDVRLAALH